MELIGNTWSQEIQGNTQWILQQKLKSLSRELSMCSRELIGDVFATVKQLEADMNRLEQEYKSMSLITQTLTDRTSTKGKRSTQTGSKCKNQSSDKNLESNG